MPRGTSDAGEVADRAASAASSLALDRGIEVHMSQPSIPARLGVDADTGERILAPLMENACRYATSKVRLEARASTNAIEFRVSDDGPGVAPADRERIFEPGERGGAGFHGNGDHGAGLGLPLARRLARAVNGEVDCLESSPGALFRARIPLG